MKVLIGLVDDHQLFLRAVSLMIDGFEKFVVVIEALNGKDLQEKIRSAGTIPEIMLIDVNMSIMDGVATAAWLKKEYPAMKLVALSMESDDKTVIAMIRSGCCAYLLKDTHPNELEKALLQIEEKGYYNGDLSNVNARRLLKSQLMDEQLVLSENEKQFLQLAASDQTYKQIAAAMFRSERTIDDYREKLFQKLQVQSRVGMVLEAIRRGFVKL